jgi:hypothetical protein
MLRLTRLCAGLTFVVGLAVAARADTVTQNGVIVGDVWSRPAVANGVMYLTMVNKTAVAEQLDRVVCACAKRVELHESESMTGMEGMVMEMKPVPAIIVLPGRSLTLDPGGYHVMLIGLKKPLVAGQRIPMRLHFLHAGWVDVTSVVRSE